MASKNGFFSFSAVAVQHKKNALYVVELGQNLGGQQQDE
jgi:hypothetical protein